MLQGLCHRVLSITVIEGRFFEVLISLRSYDVPRGNQSVDNIAQLAAIFNVRGISLTEKIKVLVDNIGKFNVPSKRAVSQSSATSVGRGLAGVGHPKTFE